MFSRDPDKDSASTPENKPSTSNNLTVDGCGDFTGIGHSLNGRVPSEPIGIVLPKLNNNPIRNVYITDEMRLLVGLINDERARRGLNRLEISKTLTTAAQNYVDLFAIDDLTANEAYSVNHYYNSTSGARAIDLGYPGFRDPKLSVQFHAGVAENLAFASYILEPKGVFEMWMNSQGHRNTVLWPHFKTIGVAIEKVAAAEFADLDTTSIASQRAGLTGDFGDSTIQLGGEPGDGDSGAGQGPSWKLNVRARRIRGGKVVVRAQRNRRLGEGKLSLAIRTDGRRIVRATRRGKLVVRVKSLKRVRAEAWFVRNGESWRVATKRITIRKARGL